MLKEINKKYYNLITLILLIINKIETTTTRDKKNEIKFKIFYMVVVWHTDCIFIMDN